jgi:transposase
VKTERRDWLADNPFHTKRFAFYVGQRCRDSTAQAIAEELRLEGQTVKELDKQYMAEQLRQAGPPAPAVIGRDEIAIGHGHRYRIAVSDRLLGRPLGFGGTDRSEASLDRSYAWRGPEKAAPIRLAVLDMGKAFRNATLQEGNAPRAWILFDKFPVLSHPPKAPAPVRKNADARLTGPGRRFIKGQKYALWSRWQDVSLRGKTARRLLFKATRRWHTAYLLQESFGQLGDYQTPGWAQRLVAPWREALKWPRLKPYQKCATPVEEHGDGIVAYGHTTNEVALGFVEGLNTKIRELQRRACGSHDEGYLRLKILTGMLPKLQC